jgi:hypothetical protein
MVYRLNELAVRPEEPNFRNPGIFWSLLVQTSSSPCSLRSRRAWDCLHVHGVPHCVRPQGIIKRRDYLEKKGNCGLRFARCPLLVTIAGARPGLAYDR